jgi:hypothetical protein
MEYRHSTIVDPSTYTTDSLCDGVPLRIHRTQRTEDLGAIRAQWDWRTHVNPHLSFNYKASLGPAYNFLSVAFPETIPGRMEVLAYFDEFIFLHDDVVEAVDQEEGDAQNDEALGACRDGVLAEEKKSLTSRQITAKERRNTGRKFMVDKVSKTMMEMDPGPAEATLKLWAEWFDKGAGRRNHSRFETLDEYLEYRILDVGKM